jgi:class 3 adenylate cyclase
MCEAMMDSPETRYAKTPDGLHVAYQTVGEGPRDILFLPYMAAIDAVWEEPSFAHVLDRLATMGRLILLDPTGSGAADPISLGALPTPERWTDDIRIALDAVGSTSAHVVCHAFGAMGTLFAATYPERTASLVLIDSYARAARGDDYPIGWPPDVCEAVIDATEQAWGTGSGGAAFAPSRASDREFLRWHGRYERAAMGKSTVAAFMRWVLALDIRAVLPAIRVPTLVLHQERSRVFPTAFGEYLAAHIDGARFQTLPGADSFLYGDAADDALDLIEEFVTGAPVVREPDRALATVMFTDVVESTPAVTRIGDRGWRQLFDRHDVLVSRELERYRGRKVRPTGDGLLATFDGPARAVRCAQALCRGVRQLGIELRAGLHTGEVELRGDDIGGIAVHIGQRVSALAGPSEVLVSRTVTDLVAGSGLEFEDRGEHELKGVPGKWSLYALRP